MEETEKSFELKEWNETGSGDFGIVTPRWNTGLAARKYGEAGGGGRRRPGPLGRVRAQPPDSLLRKECDSAVSPGCRGLVVTLCRGGSPGAAPPRLYTGPATGRPSTAS